MTALIVDEQLWQSMMTPEGILDSWRASSGDWVRAGQPLCELQIEGRVHVVTAPRSGQLQQYAEDGSLVEPGALIGAINPPDSWYRKEGAP